MTKTEAIEKVIKLLALSESPNEHEAALAAAHAKRILTQYNLTGLDIDEATGKHSFVKEYAVIFPVFTEWINRLSKAVEELYNCQVYISTGDPRYPDDTLAIFIGEDANAKISAYVLDYLVNAIARHAEVAWEQYEKEQEEGGYHSWVQLDPGHFFPITRSSHSSKDRFIKSYCIGATMRVIDEMREEIWNNKQREQQAAQEEGALIVYMKDAIDKFVENKYGEPTPLDMPPPSQSEIDGYAASRGYQESGDIKTRPGIERSKTDERECGKVS